MTLTTGRNISDLGFPPSFHEFAPWRARLRSAPAFLRPDDPEVCETWHQSLLYGMHVKLVRFSVLDPGHIPLTHARTHSLTHSLTIPLSCLNLSGKAVREEQGKPRGLWGRNFMVGENPCPVPR